MNYLNENTLNKIFVYFDNKKVPGRQALLDAILQDSNEGVIALVDLNNPETIPLQVITAWGTATFDSMPGLDDGIEAGIQQIISQCKMESQGLSKEQKYSMLVQMLAKELALINRE